ncbi:MAG: hypothetical protein RLN84_08255 [Rhodospirillaceae bacterium]
MRSQAYHSVMRKILAALIESDLTPADLRSFAQTARKVDWSVDIADVAERAAFLIADLQRRDTGSTSEFYLSPEDGAFEAISRRRMAKAEVFELMERATRGRAIRWIEPDKTLRENLDRFFSKASNSDAVSFLEMLNVYPGTDEYLQGITRK